jgi:hypothetical protein
LQKELASCPGVIERMIENLAVLLAVYDFYASRIRFSFTRAQLTEYMVQAMKNQAAKRISESETQRFWECIMMAKKAGMITHGKEYSVDGNSLYIQITQVFPYYSKTHYDIFRAPASSKNSILDKLKKSKAYTGSKDGWRFGPDSRSSAHVFDLSNIDQSVMNVLAPEQQF